MRKDLPNDILIQNLLNLPDLGNYYSFFDFSRNNHEKYSKACILSSYLQKYAILFSWGSWPRWIKDKAETEWWESCGLKSGFFYSEDGTAEESASSVCFDFYQFD